MRTYGEGDNNRKKRKMKNMIHPENITSMTHQQKCFMERQNRTERVFKRKEKCIYY